LTQLGWPPTRAGCAPARSPPAAPTSPRRCRPTNPGRSRDHGRVLHRIHVRRVHRRPERGARPRPSSTRTGSSRSALLHRQAAYSSPLEIPRNRGGMHYEE
jgi:hypothetical protein